MRRIVGLFLGQHRTGGNPAGRAAHHFDDAAGSVVGGHAANIRAHFHHSGGVVLDHAAVARGMVGVREIVVDRLGDADGTDVVPAFGGFLVHLVGGVLTIVTAGIEKVADVVRLDHLKQSVHILLCLLGVFLEIDFITAGA